jgi:hypothetical protein
VDSGHFLQIPEPVCNEFAGFNRSAGIFAEKSKQTRIGGKNNTGRGSIVSNLNAFLFSSRHKSANLNGLRRLKTVGVLRLETGGLIPPKLTGMNGRRITLSIDAQPSNVK